MALIIQLLAYERYSRPIDTTLDWPAQSQLYKSPASETTGIRRRKTYGDDKTNQAQQRHPG